MLAFAVSMAATPSPRTATLPALVYVLAAFGVISGSYGTLAALTTVSTYSQPRDIYLKAVTASHEMLVPLVDAKALEKFDAHEADARYGRRNASLPIAGLGMILSCLMFAGAMRAMRGDAWGLSAWRFAAGACIPYQLLSLGFTVAIARDLAQAVAELPAPAQLLVGGWPLMASVGFCGLAIVYYGVCVIYLRTPTVRRAFSAAAGRTPPSA